MNSIHEILNYQYYKKSTWIYLLLPLSLIFLLIISIRKLLYKLSILKTFKIRVPVVVVGNINLGGTGKTPLVMWILENMLNKGLNPGLISRGYGSKINNHKEVKLTSKASDVGDEPLLIKSKLNLPVFVGADRVKVAQALLSKYPKVNIIISDDGLQHYRLARDFEIIVKDSLRNFGNGYIFPAGPLREPISRLNVVDAVVVNGSSDNKNYYKMSYQTDSLINCKNEKKIKVKQLPHSKSIAITAIGNPENFFRSLAGLDLKFSKIIFDDHYLFTEKDFNFLDSYTNIIMTEKDAIKCKSFARDNFWYLPIEPKVDQQLFLNIIKKLGIK